MVRSQIAGWAKRPEQLRYCFKTGVFSRQVPFKRLHIGAAPIQSSGSREPRWSSPIWRSVSTVWSRNSKEHFFLWINGLPRQHFGPMSRIPDLFQRRDQLFFALESQDLKWQIPPPMYHHDLLEAAAKVGVLEERLGYTFKNKMTCIEALKVTGTISPLYFRGSIYMSDGNRRLALLGDRVLSLALCEIWYETGHPTADYNRMVTSVETRAALSARGRALNLHKSVLFSISSSGPTDDNVAETVEAILGAIYADSSHHMPTIKKIIKRLGLDRNEFLIQLDEISKKAKLKRDLGAMFELGPQKDVVSISKTMIVNEMQQSSTVLQSLPESSVGSYIQGPATPGVEIQVAEALTVKSAVKASSAGVTQIESLQTSIRMTKSERMSIWQKASSLCPPVKPSLREDATRKIYAKLVLHEKAAKARRMMQERLREKKLKNGLGERADMKASLKVTAEAMVAIRKERREFILEADKPRQEKVLLSSQTTKEERPVVLEQRKQEKDRPTAAQVEKVSQLKSQKGTLPQATSENSARAEAKTPAKNKKLLVEERSEKPKIVSTRKAMHPEENIGQKEGVLLQKKDAKVQGNVPKNVQSSIVMASSEGQQKSTSAKVNSKSESEMERDIIASHNDAWGQPISKARTPPRPDKQTRIAQAQNLNTRTTSSQSRKSGSRPPR